MQHSLRMAIVGAGNVVRQRYSMGLASLYAAGFPLSVEALFSLDDEESMEPLLEQGPFKQAFYRRLPGDPREGARIISDCLPPEVVPVIATPTAFHVPYALELLPVFHQMAIEKPLCLDVALEAQFEEAIQAQGARWFPLSYYLLEKGLPYTWLQGDWATPALAPLFLKGSLASGEPISIRRLLGRCTRLEACILEGRGDAGSLGHRPWVLSPAGGGNTWETLFHLVALLAMTWPDQTVRIKSTRRALCTSWVSLADGWDAADSARGVVLEGEGFTARLMAAKGISAKDHQRWLVAEYEHGRLFMDLETRRLTLHGPVRTDGLELRWQAPYETQFRLLWHWLQAGISLPLGAYRKALRLTAAIQRRDCEESCCLYPSGLPARDLAERLGLEDLLDIVRPWRR